MNRICKTGLAIMVVAMSAASGTAARASGEPGMRFRCEAERSQQHYCSVETRDGITLVKQLSRTPCLQGRNWDYDRHGVWVSHRCGAEFVTGTVLPASSTGRARTIRCESRGAGIQHCAADTSRGVRLTRLLSSSDCVENRDWGFDVEGIWTAKGCRAEFTLENESDAGSDRALSPVPHRLSCHSKGQQRKHCAAAVGKGVDLLRQLSKTRCVQGANWGWEPSGIWVDKGCRAEFRVH